MSEPLVHYIVIRRDLTFGEYSAQIAHAGEAYALRRDIEGRSLQHSVMGFNETIAIVKGAKNEGRLLKLERALVDEGFPHVAIREETGEKGGRLAGQLTCISLMPTERTDAIKKLLNDFHNIDGLTGPVETKCA